MQYDFSKYEHAPERCGSEIRSGAARELGMIKFGPELDGYLENYGYLAYEDIELLGMVRKSGLDSDLVRTSKAAHGTARWMRGYAVLYKPTDDDYILVNPDDWVFISSLGTPVVMALGMKVNEYIWRLFHDKWD